MYLYTILLSLQLLNEIISVNGNPVSEYKKRISRASKPSHTEDGKSPHSEGDASYLADSVWANIESVESVDPYPGQAKIVDPYPGEAETEGSKKEPNPPPNHNKNAPGRLYSRV